MTARLTNRERRALRERNRIRDAAARAAHQAQRDWDQLNPVDRHGLPLGWRHAVERATGIAA